MTSVFNLFLIEKSEKYVQYKRMNGFQVISVSTWPTQDQMYFLLRNSIISLPFFTKFAGYDRVINTNLSWWKLYGKHTSWFRYHLGNVPIKILLFTSYILKFTQIFTFQVRTPPTTWSVAWLWHLSIKFLMICTRSVNMLTSNSRCRLPRCRTPRCEVCRSAIRTAMCHRRNMCDTWLAMSTGKKLWLFSVLHVQYQTYATIQQNHAFQALPVETLGPWPQNLVEIVNKPGSLVHLKTGEPRSRCLLVQRIFQSYLAEKFE